MDTRSVAHPAHPPTRQTSCAESPRSHCAGCGEPASRLAPLHGAKTGTELRALPLYGTCCNPRIRPRSRDDFAAIFGAL